MTDRWMRVTLLLSLVVAVFASEPARSDWKPDRDVKIINGFAAGGAGDVLCRIIAEGLKPIFGRPVIVESRAGANGFIAAEATANSPPDGHTVTLVTMSMLTVAPQLPGNKLAIDPNRDLTPVSALANIAVIAAAPPDAPFNNPAELIAYAKSHPNELSYGSSGRGSAPHLAAELFNSLADTKMVHVPYRGGGPALIDLMTGRIQLMIGNLPDFLGAVKDGKLKVIGAAGASAGAELPKVPSIGASLPGYSVQNWFGFAGPRRLPENIAKAWSDAIVKVLNDPETRKRLTTLALEPLSGSTEELKSLTTGDFKRWGEVIQKANIRIE
jgi:tripartite-type tricarboxylate transporter receptor subunit TctC